MTAPYIMVWDLDRTLGVFDGLHGVVPGWTGPVKVELRPELEAALSALSARGWVHRVLTLASPTYARLALEGTGLAQAFERIEGRGERHKGDVAGIALDYELDEACWGDRMFFVGDHMLYDPPRHHRVLFHYEPHALSRSAMDVVGLVEALLEHGEGSLVDGFAAIMRNPGLSVEGRPLRPTRPGYDVARRQITHVADPLIFARRGEDEGPVIAFEAPPEKEWTPEVRVITPG